MKKVLLTGSSGFIGSAVFKELCAKGFDVICLSSSKKESPYFWNYKQDIFPDLSKTKVDIVINLAGENILGYWTKAKKKRIYQSRVHTATFLNNQLNKQGIYPEVFIQASGVHASDRNSEGFLSSVIKKWEETSQILSPSTRVIHLRLGIVLDPRGGLLKSLMTPFKLGLGAQLGDGNQWMSWISLEDLLSIILYSINNKAIKGTINTISPSPVTNKDFTRTLAKALKRPTLFKIPACFLSIITGDLGREVLLDSVKEYPINLLDKKYCFKHKKLNSALADFSL